MPLLRKRVTKQCFHIPQQGCATSKGDALRAAAAKRTGDLVPEPHRFTSWLVFNNMSDADEQFRQKDLVATVCDFFVGDDPPEYCTGLGFLAYASKKKE